MGESETKSLQITGDCQGTCFSYSSFALGWRASHGFVASPWESQVALLAQKCSASFTSGIDMIETNQANLVYASILDAVYEAVWTPNVNYYVR